MRQVLDVKIYFGDILQTFSSHQHNHLFVSDPGVFLSHQQQLTVWQTHMCAEISEVGFSICNICIWACV